jgi:hypothetical protein
MRFSVKIYSVRTRKDGTFSMRDRREAEPAG